MRTLIDWISVIGCALAFPHMPVWAEDEAQAKPAWASVPNVIKAEGLKMRTEGWADGKPQPMKDQEGNDREWPWYRLTFEGGPKTYVFYSQHKPYMNECSNVSLVDRAGEEWLRAKMGFEKDADKPQIYFPLQLDGKAGSFLPDDEGAEVWKLSPSQKLYDWENSPELKNRGQLAVERMVQGKPQPIRDGETESETANLYRATIQYDGKLYVFYPCETQPFSGRWIKVTRESFLGQDCFKLTNMMDELEIEIYLPIAMAGRYGSFLPVMGGGEHTYILKSLDDIMMEYFALATEDVPKTEDGNPDGAQDGFQEHEMFGQ